jgi:hypothetical protein
VLCEKKLLRVHACGGRWASSAVAQACHVPQAQNEVLYSACSQLRWALARTVGRGKRKLAVGTTQKRHLSSSLCTTFHFPLHRPVDRHALNLSHASPVTPNREWRPFPWVVPGQRSEFGIPRFNSNSNTREAFNTSTAANVLLHYLPSSRSFRPLIK